MGSQICPTCGLDYAERDTLRLDGKKLGMAARLDGMRRGIRKYSYWKDGVLVVGDGETTLRDALKETED